jgi:AcrR family transcriptional regulator
VTKTEAARTRRPYDSTLRRERAAQTRERIVVAGAELIRGASIRDWRGLTIRAVAERAGVNERTVYRHFENERVLRDEVMHHLEQKVGVDLARMQLDDVAGAAARIFEHLSAYPLDRRRPLEPTLIEANRRQHESLATAVEGVAEQWTEIDRTLAAATLDVLWSVASYERIVVDWQLDHDDAVRAITWAIGLVEDAIRDGRRPPRAEPVKARDDGASSPKRARARAR